jgi:deazaflavin-dependent oxidoreductase (nitroreductase family)
LDTLVARPHDKETAMAEPDFNTRIIEEFRANAGRVGGPFEGTTLLLLHTDGARSGTHHTTPVVYLQDGGRYVIVASKAGAPRHPGWYHNLKAHPDLHVEVGDRTIDVTAEELSGDERQRLYDTIVELMPQFGEYQANTSRVIPIIALTPKG